MTLKDRLQESFNRTAGCAYRPARDISNGWVKSGGNGVFFYEGARQFYSFQGMGRLGEADVINAGYFFFDNFYVVIEEDKEIIDVIEL